MLTHRGFSAWISVDDEALPEYLVAVDGDANRVSCWIPGEEGKIFTVWWRDHGGKVDTCSFITLDGLVVPGRFLLGEGVASRAGTRSSHITERPFTFMKMPETDDGQEPNPDSGTIVLRIKRVDRVESRPANSLQPLPPSTIAGKRKAGDLCVGFGPEQSAPLQYSSTWNVIPHDRTRAATKPSTYVSFVFRYRSQEFLEAQGIATAVKKKPVPLKPPEPKVGEKRRVASLPLLASTALLATPSPSPPKRPRLTGPVLSDQAALGHRRPSSDLRRVVSYRPTTQTNPKSETTDTYTLQQSLFLLPRNENQRLSLDVQSTQLMTSIMGAPPPSAMSDATSTSDEDDSQGQRLA